MKPDRMTSAEFRALHGAAPVVSTGKPQIRVPKVNAPNKIEANFREQALRIWPGCSIYYEPITLRLNSGKYTPDWMVCADSKIILVECKGPHIHESGRASKRAFIEAMTMFPCFRFLFAQKRAEGWVYEPHILSF